MKINSIIALTLLVFIVTACSFSTANISELKFGKNEQANPPTTSFNVGERVFAVAAVSNAMGKHKVKYQVNFDNVQGKSKGESAVKTDIDIDGSNVAFINFNAVMPGDYSVEVTLVNEDGKEIDKKSGTFKVTGSAPTAPAAPQKDDADADAEDK